MFRSLLFIAALTAAPTLRAAQFPLESIEIEGTQASREAVLAIFSARIGAPIDKAGIEEGCKRLETTGLFETVQYAYRPGPKKGMDVQLTLKDAGPLVDAAIDIPGADEKALWAWLDTLFPAFNHAVPGGAQDYLAQLIQKKLAGSPEEQPVAALMEDDLTLKKPLIVFQPHNLRPVTSVTFTGQHAFTAAELNAVVDPRAKGRGYTNRDFRYLVEVNLRQAYEDRGLYRVEFPAISAQKTGDGMAASVSIEDGPVYTLGAIDFAGDPVAQELRPLNGFPVGQVANWSLIQKELWAIDGRLRQNGFMEGGTRPERIFDDQKHVMNLKVSAHLGPQYRFGDLKMSGLTPALEMQARALWNPPSEFFRGAYPTQFLQTLLKSPEYRALKISSVKEESDRALHRVNVSVSFVPR